MLWRDTIPTVIRNCNQPVLVAASKSSTTTTSEYSTLELTIPVSPKTGITDTKNFPFCSTSTVTDVWLPEVWLAYSLPSWSESAGCTITWKPVTMPPESPGYAHLALINCGRVSTLQFLRWIRVGPGEPNISGTDGIHLATVNPQISPKLGFIFTLFLFFKYWSCCFLYLSKYNS